MVVMVRVAVPAVMPVMLTGLVEPKVRVGGYCAPVGLEGTEAVSTTLPVKPPAGVRVTVDVFPVVPPGAKLTAVAVIVRLGGTGAVTLTDAVPEAVPYARELAASGVYDAMRVLTPTAKDPAGTLIVALPLLRVVEEDM